MTLGVGKLSHENASGSQVYGHFQFLVSVRGGIQDQKDGLVHPKSACRQRSTI